MMDIASEAFPLPPLLLPIISPCLLLESIISLLLQGCGATPHAAKPDVALGCQGPKQRELSSKGMRGIALCALRPKQLVVLVGHLGRVKQERQQRRGEA